MTGRSRHQATVIEQHNHRAPAYARLVAGMPKERSEAFRALLAPRPYDRVLDVACGPGLLSLGLAPHVTEVVALDPTPGMLAEAQKLQVAAKVWNVRWVIGDAALLPFGDATFSLVICSGSFHHFNDPHAVVREMMRVCPRGGRIVIHDVTPPPDKSDAFNRLEKMRDPSHHRAHSVEQLQDLGRAAGLGEARVVHDPTGLIPFEAVLASSLPLDCSLDEIAEVLAEDARSGKDRYGLKACFAEDRLLCSYPTSTLIWERT